MAVEAACQAVGGLLQRAEEKKAADELAAKLAPYPGAAKARWYYYGAITEADVLAACPNLIPGYGAALDAGGNAIPGDGPVVGIASWVGFPYRTETLDQDDGLEMLHYDESDSGDSFVAVAVATKPGWFVDIVTVDQENYIVAERSYRFCPKHGGLTLRYGEVPA